jgi:hypothetical protein
LVPKKQVFLSTPMRTTHMADSDHLVSLLDRTEHSNATSRTAVNEFHILRVTDSANECLVLHFTVDEFELKLEFAPQTPHSPLLAPVAATAFSAAPSFSVSAMCHAGPTQPHHEHSGWGRWRPWWSTRFAREIGVVIVGN